MDYDYNKAVIDDVRTYIEENYTEDEVRAKLEEDEDEFREELNDTLWTEDSVTGNASGSYTFSAYNAEKNLVGNWDLAIEAAEDFGVDVGEMFKKGAENVDVTVRCYLLASAIDSVLDEYKIRFGIAL